MLDVPRAAIASFEQDGIAFPIRVLEPEEVRRYSAALADVEAALGGRVKRLDWAHLFFDWAFELTTHPRVIEPIAAILGPDVLVQSSRLLCKHPHDRSFVGWHQDGLYSGLNHGASVTAWIALSAATADNGCLRVIPGSHRLGMLSHVETYAADNLSNHGEEVAVAFDRDAAVDVALGPGEMSLHHVNVIHGSDANRSDTTRIGYSISYVTPAVGSVNTPVVAACGCDAADGFDLWKAPPHQSTARALSQHAEFLRGKGYQPNRIRPPS
jgi:non-haem Fe2+, alpha-ketoglutarate-dependent halogenase